MTEENDALIAGMVERSKDVGAAAEEFASTGKAMQEAIDNGDLIQWMRILRKHARKARKLADALITFSDAAEDFTE